jgi:hypothetical protein
MAESPLPKLLVSQEQAEEKIKAQIDRGRQIAYALAPSQVEFGFAEQAALRTAKAEGEMWANFTIDLLKTLFTDLPIGKEFG